MHLAMPTVVTVHANALYCIVLNVKNWTMNRLSKSAQIEMLNTHTNKQHCGNERH